MLDYIIHAADMNLHYGKVHLEDIPVDMFCAQPNGFINHPAWLVGHIVTSYAAAMGALGTPPNLPDGWDTLFGMDSSPHADAGRYPEKQELLKYYAENHLRLTVTLRNASPDSLEHPIQIPELKAHFKTAGDLAIAIMTTHEGIHLGQLGSWRCAIGMDMHL